MGNVTGAVPKKESPNEGPETTPSEKLTGTTTNTISRRKFLIGSASIAAAAGLPAVTMVAPPQANASTSSTRPKETTP